MLEFAEVRVPFAERGRSRMFYHQRLVSRKHLVQVAERCPFPEVNHRSALALSGYENSIYSNENEFMIGDLGNIYLFRGKDGQLKNMVECY